MQKELGNSNNGLGSNFFTSTTALSKGDENFLEGSVTANV